MATFTKIASATVGSGGASSIEFTSIPSTYTDLVIKLSMRSAYTSFNRDDLRLTFNSNAGSWTDQQIGGNGSTIFFGQNGWSGSAGFPGQINTAITSSNVFSNGEIYVFNYAGSGGKNWASELVQESNAVEIRCYLSSGLWSNSAAVTSIQIAPHNSTLVQYSTATLYGISNS